MNTKNATHFPLRVRIVGIQARKRHGIGKWVGSTTRLNSCFIQTQPTEPKAGILQYEPGASFPLHKYDFAQVWYILEGEFEFGDTIYKSGRFALMPDPHFEHEMMTETGGKIIFLQYPGPTTRATPIYAGRMNLKAKQVKQYEPADLDH